MEATLGNRLKILCEKTSDPAQNITRDLKALEGALYSAKQAGVPRDSKVMQYAIYVWSRSKIHSSLYAAVHDESFIEFPVETKYEALQNLVRDLENLAQKGRDHNAQIEHDLAKPQKVTNPLDFIDLATPNIYIENTLIDTALERAKALQRDLKLAKRDYDKHMAELEEARKAKAKNKSKKASKKKKKNKRKK